MMAVVFECSRICWAAAAATLAVVGGSWSSWRVSLSEDVKVVGCMSLGSSVME